MITGIGIKTYYSIQHAQAAAYFARQASSIESNPDDETEQARVALHAYVASTLFSSVAFLEALANELYADAAQPDGGHLSALPERDRALIAELGATETIQKAPVLSKFDLLLRGAGKAALPKDRAPYQVTATLIRLRNEIVHYKASFFDIGSEGMVRPGNFNDSNLSEQVRNLFPHRIKPRGWAADNWMSSGCARWAVTTAVTHADAVFHAMSIDPYYNHVRASLDLNSK